MMLRIKLNFPREDISSGVDELNPHSQSGDALPEGAKENAGKTRGATGRNGVVTKQFEELTKRSVGFAKRSESITKRSEDFTMRPESITRVMRIAQCNLKDSRSNLGSSQWGI